MPIRVKSRRNSAQDVRVKSIEQTEPIDAVNNDDIDAKSSALQILKYPGSKAALKDEIVRHFPPHITYVEAFGGGGSVLLYKQPSQVEYYNDLDGDLVEFFKMLRKGGDLLEQLSHEIEYTPYARSELVEARKIIDSDSGDAVERARALLICAWMSRMSQIHGAKTGWVAQKTDIRAVKRWNKLPDRLRQAAQRMKEVYVEHRPAIQLIKSLDTKDTLFYLDPPYPDSVLSANNKQKNYYRHVMTDADHKELLEAILKIKGKAIISGYRHDLYDEMLSNWHRIDIAHHTAAGSFKTECLWMNFQPKSQIALFGEHE